MAIVLAGGFAYLAWEFYGRNERDAARLTTLASETAELAGRLERTRNERDQLQARTTDLDGRVQALERELARKTGTLANVEGELTTAKVYRDAMELQLAEFRKVTRMFRKMIDAGKLEVEFRRGRMMLELPDSVLFDSGSAELSKDGRATLRRVAKTLRRVSGRRFIVAGHTDDVPVHNERYASNWELSVHRGVVVVKALLQYGVRASRIAAAGFADTARVASNRNAQGRQRNRRIEIIIEPHVVELPNLDERLKKAKAEAKAKIQSVATQKAAAAEPAPDAASSDAAPAPAQPKVAAAGTSNPAPPR